MSVLVLGTVSALGVYATSAFFSDTETSTGNTFVAGEIDLKVDNTSYVTDVNGDLVASPETSWQLSDLTNQLFFNFTDLKPGDIGEDTISLHVNSNDSYICAAARVTKDTDNTYTEPELSDDLTVGGDPTLTDGELAENLNFAFWGDDGDNVLEDDEVDNIFVSGPASNLNLAGQIALADSTHNVWGTPGVVTANTTVYVGKAWCFGTLTTSPVAQGEDGPLVRGTGFTCDGATVNNAAQTDNLMGDLEFYAVQSRNNSDFLCSTDYKPTWPTAVPAVALDSI